MIGSMVGNYKITEKLGEGGMGQVFRAVDTMLEREVAIKVLHRQLTQDADRLLRFRSEAVTLAKLNHENIATLHSFFEHQGDYYMVMEFVDGETFENIIRRLGVMPVRRGLELFCHSLRGFEHAHSKKVIHRDIKPGNLMLNSAGVVKITDFGIAHVVGRERLTQAGRLIGTLEYMSPEQVKGLEQDQRSDIYSLGILLYEMLTGSVPFTSSSDYEIMRAHLEERPAPAHELMATIPPGVEAAIERAMAKNPDERFQNTAELRTNLEGIIAGLPQDRAKITAQARETRIVDLGIPAAIPTVGQPPAATALPATPAPAPAVKATAMGVVPGMTTEAAVPDVTPPAPRKTSPKPAIFAAAGGALGLVVVALILLLGPFGKHKTTNGSTTDPGNTPVRTETPATPTTGGETPVAPVVNPGKDVKFEYSRKDIPFSVQEMKTGNYPLGERHVKTPGQKGIEETMIEVTYEGGKEVSRRIVGTKIVKQPVNQVMLIGTRKAAPPRPRPQPSRPRPRPRPSSPQPTRPSPEPEDPSDWKN